MKRIILTLAAVALGFVGLLFLARSADEAMGVGGVQAPLDDVPDRFAQVVREDAEADEEEGERLSSRKVAGGEEGRFGDPNAAEDDGGDDEDDAYDYIDARRPSPREAALIAKAMAADKAPAPPGGASGAVGGELPAVFGDSAGFDSKLNAAMSGVGDELVVGKGAGGLGLRGAGRGGGGFGEASIGAGRVSGLGRVDTGGGRGSGSERGKKRRKAKPKPAPGFFAAPRSGEQRERQDRAAPPLNGPVAKDEKKLARPVERKPEPVVTESTVVKGKVSKPRRDGWTQRFTPPGTRLPRMAYFENTYLGRDAGYLEELRQLDRALPRARPWARAALPDQPFDAPGDAGLALSAQLSVAGVDQPQRVYLQVGLKGSERFGWRRPPLDVVLVVDAALRLGQPRAYAEAVDTLLAKLSPVDRLAVIHAGPRPTTALALSAVRDAKIRRADLLAPGRGAARNGDLPAALGRAGQLLRDGEQGARVPGTGTVVLLTRAGSEALVARTARAAHALTVAGAVTSVISTDERAPWWRVAKAGHGNDHRGRRVADALQAELTSLSKVIARLLRLNVRLGPNAHGIKILGSRILTQAEKRRVKAREEATDKQISKSLGVTADRGADDDGLQTVIPFFYGGDAHVVLIELWVEKPGAVADITLKYKDMVSLRNATARTSVRVGAVPRAPGPAELLVLSNLQGFQLAQALREAGDLARRGDLREAQRRLRAAPRRRPADEALVHAFSDLLNAGGPAPTLGRALTLAARRRISPSPAVARR